MEDQLHVYKTLLTHLKHRTDEHKTHDGTKYEDLKVSDQPIPWTWLGAGKKKKNGQIGTHYNLKTEWMTMHSNSCYMGKEVDSKNTSYSNTPKTKDSTITGKAMLEDPHILVNEGPKWVY